jgi:hypothetical protein
VTKDKSSFLPVLLLTWIFLAGTGGSGLGPGARLMADAQEEVAVWVELEVTSLYENQFKAGDPPVTVRLTNEVSFTRSDVWTIARLKGAREMYHIFPGRVRGQRMPDVNNLSVRQSHPCQDGQGLLIGRETRQLSARVHPASGWIRVEGAGAGKVRLHLLPTTIDNVEHIDCPKQNCQNGPFGGDRPFLGWGRIGENPSATTTDENGYETVYGFDIAVMEWSTLKGIAENSELPLAFPINVEDVQQKDYEDPPGYPARETVTYQVRGSISPAPKSGSH